MTTKGGHGQTNQLHDITFDYASRAPQLMSCNYYLHTCGGLHVV